MYSQIQHNLTQKLSFIAKTNSKLWAYLVNMGVVARFPPPPNFFQSWDQVEGPQFCNKKEFPTIGGIYTNFLIFNLE
jgi:hypothetical protein